MCVCGCVWEMGWCSYESNEVVTRSDSWRKGGDLPTSKVELQLEREREMTVKLDGVNDILLG